MELHIWLNFFSNEKECIDACFNISFKNSAYIS
jgi:hypothetical protein